MPRYHPGLSDPGETRAIQISYDAGDGKRTVLARDTTVPGLVVHHPRKGFGVPEGTCYTITHEASGYAVFAFVPADLLNKILAVLGNMGHDWTEGDVNKVSTTPAAFNRWLHEWSGRG